jgi:mRNA interferase MazF
MTRAEPARGDIWLIDFDPTRGHEQAGKRPALVISADLLNQSGAEIAIVVPITSKGKGIRSHVPIDPPEGGTKTRSFIKCEDIRSVSRQRLLNRWGAVGPTTLAAVEDVLRILLAL